MHRKKKKKVGDNRGDKRKGKKKKKTILRNAFYFSRFYLLASPRCEALLGAGGSGASLGGATSRIEGGARGAAERSEEAPSPLIPVVSVTLALAMLQSALSKCWWRCPPALRLGPFFLWAGRRPP